MSMWTASNAAQHTHSCAALHMLSPSTGTISALAVMGDNPRPFCIVHIGAAYDLIDRHQDSQSTPPSRGKA